MFREPICALVILVALPPMTSPDLSRFSPEDKLFLTNLNKVYWPKEGYTKRDMIEYYKEISTVILPYLKDRPQVLHRHVDGHQGKEFFQRVSRHAPGWVPVVKVPLEKGPRDYHLCNDWPTLLCFANFGCIELIPWNSRLPKIDRPDYMVVDLDPEDVPFQKIVETAQVVRKVLEKAGAESYCKTSGKRGLHIYVPVGQQYGHEHVKLFGELIARMVHKQLPDITSMDPRIENRQNKIYLDHTRNGRGQALAAPYCLRPYPGARVSAPLKWSEVRKGLDPSKYNIKTMAKRLDKVGDLWEPVLGPGVDMQKCLQRLVG